jgi:hypothetical protein
MHIKSCISGPALEYLTADISDLYLGTPLDTPEYMVIRLDQMPQVSQRKYIHDSSLVHNGCVLVEIIRTLYGLPPAGRLSQQGLIPHLESHGYMQAKHTPCLFTHISRPVSFTTTSESSTLGASMPNSSSLPSACYTLSQLTGQETSI